MSKSNKYSPEVRERAVRLGNQADESDSTAPTREAMRDSARAELEALRRAASTIRHEPDDTRAAVEAMRDFMQNAEPMDDVDIRGLIEDGRAKR